MASTMWAAQYEQNGGKFHIHKIPIPEPKEGQIQIKMTAASLCHSDLMMNLRNLKAGPVTIGHEGAGVISKLHPSAEGKGLKVGDKVGMLNIIDACHACEACKVHHTFCTKPRNGGAKMQGFQADGVFAEYVVIDWQMVTHVPDSLPMDKISPLFCAGLTAFHAVDKCELSPGQWFAVIGCGGLGQLSIRYAKAMGLKVAAFDLSDHTLSVAKQNGADAAFNPKTNPKFYKELPKLTGQRGCHAAAVFSDANAAYDTAQRALAINGILMVVGLPAKPIQIPAFAISMHWIRVRGASNGTAGEMKKAVDFTAKHQIIPDVEFRRLDEMPQMWEELAEGRAKKRAVVLFGNRESKI